MEIQQPGVSQSCEGGGGIPSFLPAKTHTHTHAYTYTHTAEVSNASAWDKAWQNSVYFKKSFQYQSSSVQRKLALESRNIHLHR